MFFLCYCLSFSLYSLLFSAVVPPCQFEKLVKIRRDQENLPIWQYRSAIVAAVQSHQVVLIAGDTGCGKSTQASAVPSVDELAAALHLQSCM